MKQSQEKSLKAVVVLAAPVEDGCYFSLGVQLYPVKNPFLEFLETGPVHDVADMLLVFYRIGIDVFFDVGIAVLDDFHDTLFIAPFDEIFGKTGILLAGPA